jgi:hypothetical protein
MEERMTSNISTFRLAALAIGVAVACAPLDFAFAKGPGGGAGGGGGGGNGGGNGGASASAPGHSNANSAVAAASTQGSVASQLGALNAAHASKNGFAHANPHSRVGKIATYARLNATSPTSVQTMNALNAAANKTPVSTTTRNALDGLIGDKAATTTKSSTTTTPPTDADDTNAATSTTATQGSVAGQLGALNAAHASAAAFAHANPNSEVGKIATYAKDNAISPTSTATTNALNAAANKTPVSTTTRDALDGLIGTK